MAGRGLRTGRRSKGLIHFALFFKQQCRSEIMAYKDLAWSRCDWQSHLIFLQAQGRLPRQTLFCLYVERAWKVTTLKYGGFSPVFFPPFLSVCFIHPL